MITASVVLYNTPKNELNRLLNCVKDSAIISNLHLVDNFPGPSELPDLKSFPFVSYVKNGRNAGYGAGHNVALREVLKSPSEFHFVLNPDIYFDHGELNKMIEFMRMNKSIGQLMPKVQYRDGNIQYLCKLLPSPADLVIRRFSLGPLKHLFRNRIERFELRHTGYNRVMDVPYLSGCFMLFSVEALRKVGLFDERFFMYPEDIDITRRMSAEFRTVFFPGATVVHDHARASYKDTRFLWIHIENMIKYFNKWGWIRDPQRTRINRQTLQQFH